MERKIKIIGLYVGILFFVSILLILITSLSNDELVSRYPEKENAVAIPVGLSTAVDDNSSDFIKNEDTQNLYKALKFYMLENREELEKSINLINRDTLNEEDKQIYDILIKDLNWF